MADDAASHDAPRSTMVDHASPSNLVEIALSLAGFGFGVAFAVAPTALNVIAALGLAVVSEVVGHVRREGGP